MTYEELREEFISKSFRKAIKDSLPDACCNCGSKKSIEYHHIVPLKLGGTNRTTNIVPLCHKCHKAAHCGQHISHYSDKTNAGRKSRSNAEKHSEIFDMFINGEIGNRKCSELLGYSPSTPIKDRPSFQKYIKSKGILYVRNLIDLCCTTRRDGINDGDIVGKIEYLDGRKVAITYKCTGKNDVNYEKRVCNPRKTG